MRLFGQVATAWRAWAASQAATVTRILSSELSSERRAGAAGGRCPAAVVRGLAMRKGDNRKANKLMRVFRRAVGAWHSGMSLKKGA